MRAAMIIALLLLSGSATIAEEERTCELLKPIPTGEFNQAEFERSIENRCGKIK
jgi:hypothetical protein